MATATKATKERKAWHYKDGVKTEFKYTPSGRLSKNGEFTRKYPNGIIDVHNLRAILR